MNRIEEELEGIARVVRLSVSSEEGRQAAMAYGVRSVPTLVILNECGEVAGRVVGIPNPAEVVALVTAMPACR